MALMNKLLRKSIIEFHTVMVMWHRIFIQILVRANWFRKLFGYNLQYTIVHIERISLMPSTNQVRWKSFLPMISREGKKLKACKLSIHLGFILANKEKLMAPFVYITIAQVWYFALKFFHTLLASIANCKGWENT